MENINLETTNKFDKIAKKLKSEFIGISPQIDQIISLVKTWSMYPNFYDKPLIVNLFGMSGCGKTSLIKRLVELLELEKDFHYFNCSNISDYTDYAFKNELVSHFSYSGNTNRIFVFDEFQYASSINSDFKEKTNREISSMKPCWEMIDDGKLYLEDYVNKRCVNKMLNCLNTLQNICNPRIENCSLYCCNDCLKSLSRMEQHLMNVYFQIEENNENTNEGTVRNINFLTPTGFEVLCEASHEILHMNESDLVSFLKTISFNELVDFVSKLQESLEKPVLLDFHNSIIFVIANVDETYKVANDVNPDMSADQFHKLTQKISVYDIKKGLQNRFRNEQLARLGNIYVIYPSFSSESFNNIIDLKLKQYAEKVKETCGYELVFDKTIKSCIYNEGVYPTQGTRPLFSTIDELIKSKFSSIINKFHEDNIIDKVKFVEYTFVNNKIVVTAKDENHTKIGNCIFNDKLLLKDCREGKNKEARAITAVHESGHFIVYSMLTGKCPEKVTAVSIDKNCGGFMMEDIENSLIKSKNNLMIDIAVSLGGYCAEEIVFSKEFLTSGASEDIARATNVATCMLKNYGMINQIPCTFAHSKMNESVIVEDSQTKNVKEIKNIIETNYKNVLLMLSNYEIKPLLGECAEYLMKHSSMSKTFMKSMLKKIKGTKLYSPLSQTYYQDCLKNIKHNRLDSLQLSEFIN